MMRAFRAVQCGRPGAGENRHAGGRTGGFFPGAKSQGDWKIATATAAPPRKTPPRGRCGGDAGLSAAQSAMQSFRVFAFFPKERKRHVKFSVSDDGQISRVPAQKEAYFHGAGEYGYWKPVLFHAEKTRRRNSCVKNRAHRRNPDWPRGNRPRRPAP
jgi:hypothetical protein